MEQSYQCGNCMYKFTPKSAEKMPKSCPYCNKPDTLEKVKSAQDYLEEVDSDMEQREERASL
ncbi:hypothetical protein HYX10_02005 [Candidatus Woesearchaeota archaeon]|nr:hypothetical protein [Candidatus Woesearchaeota archaeon]